MLLKLLLIFSIATRGTCQSSTMGLSPHADASAVINTPGSAEQLVDCSKYTTAVASTPTRTTNNFNLGASITPAPSFTVPSFEEYWCSTVLDFIVDHEVYPNNEPGNCQGYLCGLNSSVRAFCSTFEAAQYSSWFKTESYPFGYNLWQHVVSSPCCDAWCNIVASTVELRYWPTPAPNPNISTIVGPDGYTYTSPSAYVVWHDVSATGDCGTLGQTYASVTLAYAPSDLSTLVATPHYDVKKINYADLFTNCTGDASYFATQSDPYFLQKHFFPSLTYPTTGLQSLDPAWANCDTNRVLNFINDPPRALLPATTLGPGPTEDPRSSTDASPLPLVPPPVPSKTDPPSGSPSTTNAGNEALGTSPTDPSSVGGSPPANPQPESSVANASEEPSITPFAIPVPGELGWSGTVINSNSVVVAGATVVAGAPASQVSGHQVSVDPEASNIIVDGQVYPLPAPNPSSSDSGPTDPVENPVSSNPGQNDPVNDPISSNTVIDGHIVQTTQSPDIIVIDGQQIVRGANPIMASGIPVALRSNGDLILGTSTLPGFIPSASAAPGKVITTAGQILTILSNGAAIDGQTLSIGQEITVSGTPVSLGLDGLVIASSTIKLPVTPTAPVITTAGQTFRLLSNGVAVDGQTLSIGQGITVSGTPISLGMDGLVIASSTINLPAITAAQVLTAAGQTITIGTNGGVIIAGTTLVPNAPAVYIAGTRISLGPNGLIVGTSTISLPTVTPAAVISAAGQAGILGPDGYFTIAGTTLSPEAPAITVAGTLISLGSNGLIIGTSTLPLPPISMVTIAGHAYPVSKVSNGLVIGGSTLYTGQPAITISGTPVALEGSGLVIGTSTVSYQDIAPSSALGIGNFILSGLNGGFAAPSMTGVGGSDQTLNNTTGNTGGVVAFQGDANRMRGTCSILPALAIVVLWTWLEDVMS